MARGWLRNVPNEQYPLIKDETTVITPHSVNFLDTRRGADIPARRLCAAGCCARCSRGGFGRRYCGNGNRHRRGSCRGFSVRPRPECGRARRAYDPRRVHGLCRRTQSRRAAAGLHQPQLPPGLYRIRSGARALGQRLGPVSAVRSTPRPIPIPTFRTFPTTTAFRGKCPFSPALRGSIPSVPRR